MRYQLPQTSAASATTVALVAAALLAIPSPIASAAASVAREGAIPAPPDAGRSAALAAPNPTAWQVGKPGAENTGVPAGTRLTRRNGNLVITTPYARYHNLDIRGFVHVKAPGVTISRSIIRGGVAARDTGLVNVTSPGSSLYLVDSTLAPAHPSIHIDGIRGSNFALRRNEITGTVDGLHIHGQPGRRASGGNVTVIGNWIHDFRHYARDPNHSDGSHNDGIQIVGGKNITIARNTLTGARNAAIMIDQGYNDVSQVSITKNLADGGSCTFNIDDNPRPRMSGITLTGNLLGRHSAGRCGIIISRGVQHVMANNLWEDTRTPTRVVHR